MSVEQTKPHATPWDSYANPADAHYLNFVAWERWMSEKLQSMPGEHAFFGVWEGMSVLERIDLYSVMVDVAVKS